MNPEAYHYQVHIKGLTKMLVHAAQRHPPNQPFDETSRSIFYGHFFNEVIPFLYSRLRETRGPADHWGLPDNACHVPWRALHLRQHDLVQHGPSILFKRYYLDKLLVFLENGHASSHQASRTHLQGPTSQEQPELPRQGLRSCRGVRHSSPALGTWRSRFINCRLDRVARYSHHQYA